MASVDMAPRCAICSLRAGFEVRHFPDTRHYGRWRLLLHRLLRRR
jgi:hypothetical protein